MSQHESEERGERVARAAQARADAAGYNGERRFGCTNDATDLAAKEAEAVRWAGFLRYRLPRGTITE